MLFDTAVIYQDYVISAIDEGIWDIDSADKVRSKVLRHKPVQTWLYPPQTPQSVARDWTQVFAAGGRRLSEAWYCHSRYWLSCKDPEFFIQELWDARMTRYHEAALQYTFHGAVRRAYRRPFLLVVWRRNTSRILIVGTDATKLRSGVFSHYRELRAKNTMSF